MKKRVSKILWYGSDVNPDGSPIIPDVSPNIERNLEGLNEGEIYIHNEDSNPFIFIRTNKNRVVAIGGANLDELFKIFLRKDKSDSTNYLLRLLGGLEVGEAIDSLIAGKGIIADANGRIQADRMELRSSLTVLELIFNRLSAIESDYSFSESG